MKTVRYAYALPWSHSLHKNIHLIENIKLFTEFNKKIFEMIVEKLKSGSQITIQDLNLDIQLKEKINKLREE